MKEKHNIKTLFDLAILAEQEVQSLYNFFANKFSDNEKASQFWALMALDEYQHIGLLYKISKSIDKNELNKPIVSSLVNDAENNIKKIQNINKSEIITVYDAYLITHEVENSELNVVFMFILGNWVKDEQQYDFAYNELVKHLERLKSARNESWLKSVL